MAAKYYSVRNGRIPGIYESWSECEAQVKGFSGAVYKSFTSLEQARAYLEGEYTAPKEDEDVSVINDNVSEKIEALKPGELIAFVDGSYDPAGPTSGYGAVIIDRDKNVHELTGSFSMKEGEEFMSMRNVTAELEGVKAAVDFALSHGYEKLTVYYDYEGIGRWADGSWQAKKQLTMAYRDFILKAGERIRIELIKVPAHSGVIYNEMVDELAKAAASKK